MILFSSLFTLLFRLSLLVQGPVEEVSLDWSSLLGVESPVSSSLTGEHLETVHGSFNGIGTLVPSIEVEEKVEVEEAQELIEDVVQPEPEVIKEETVPVQKVEKEKNAKKTF